MSRSLQALVRNTRARSRSRAAPSPPAAGSTVSVTIDAVANTTQVAEGGTWSLEWPTDLEAGSYLVTATVTAANLPVLKNDPSIEIARAPANNYVFLGFRMLKPPFSDQRFRRATDSA